jgi:hypothetical protein
MTQTIRPVPKPFPLHGVAGTMADTIHWIGWGVLFTCIPAAAVSLVLRFRASRGTERQQLRWVAAGAAFAAAGPALLLPLQALGLGPTDAFAIPLLLSLPVAIAVAVLRYRLWDLDRLVSRTVTYAAVTALLLIPYLLVLPAATRLAGGSGSLAVAAATLTAAALFQPLRRRIQDQVDRRFNRRRYDAARTVTPSPPGSATRSTWAPCTASCWGWSTRPCNPPTPGCGYDPRPSAHGRPGRDRRAPPWRRPRSTGSAWPTNALATGHRWSCSTATSVTARPPGGRSWRGSATSSP